MNCETALNLVTDFAEDRVDAPMRVVLDHHFSTCDPCRNHLAATREMLALFRGLTPVEPPLGFRAQVLDRIAQETPRAAPWWERWSLPMGRQRVPVAGLAVAGLAAGLLFSQTAFHNLPTLGANVRFPSISSNSSDSAIHGMSEVSFSGPSSFSTRLGETNTLYLLLQPSSDLNRGRVILQSVSDGLVCETKGVQTDRGQVLWPGSLRAGQLLRLPIRFRATRPGVHRVLLYIEGDRQNYRRLLLLPAYKHPRLISAYTLKGTRSTSETLEELARQFGVPIATDLTHERRQPTDLVLTQAGKAVAQVAAQRQMRWSLSEGVYNVYDGDEPQP